MGKHRIKIGQIFSREGSTDLYLLAAISKNTAILIDTTTGERWSDSVEVKDLQDIGEDEWDQLTGIYTSRKDFKRFRGVRGRDYA